jgi:hypothetical protein
MCERGRHAPLSVMSDSDSRRLVAWSVHPGPAPRGARTGRPRVVRASASLAPRPGASRLAPTGTPLAPGVLALRVSLSGVGTLSRPRPRGVLMNSRAVLTSPPSHLLGGPGCVGRSVLRLDRHGDDEYRGGGHGYRFESNRHVPLPRFVPVTRSFRVSSSHRRCDRRGRHTAVSLLANRTGDPHGVE